MLAPRRFLFAATVAAGAVLGASPTAADAQHGGHSGHITIPAGAPYTVADVEFMQGMIAHHAQAIYMSRMAESHKANPRVQRLAIKIDQSQVAEIRIMQEWLRSNGHMAPDTSSWRTMTMAGMLTTAQLTELDAAPRAAGRPQRGRLAGACGSYGLLVDVSNPEKPVRLDARADTNFSLWHTAVFSNDGKKKYTQHAYLKIPTAQAAEENCVSHNGGLIAGRSTTRRGSTFRSHRSRRAGAATAAPSAARGERTTGTG